MNALRRRLRSLTWVALVAMWALALLPTVSHALARAQGPDSVLVCTAQGPRVVAANAGDTPVPGAASGIGAHCPFCGLGSDAPPLPAAQVVPIIPALASHVLSSRAAAAPRTTVAWAIASPRAPPARA